MSDVCKTVHAGLVGARGTYCSDCGRGWTIAEIRLALARDDEIETLRAENERLSGEQARYCKEAEAECGHLGYKPRELQEKWRRQTAPTVYDEGEIVAAICDALTHEGQTAWNGDGTCIVAQYIQRQMERAAIAEADVERLRVERDEWKLDAQRARSDRDTAQLQLAAARVDGLREAAKVMCYWCEHALETIDGYEIDLAVWQDDGMYFHDRDSDDETDPVECTASAIHNLISEMMEPTP